MKTHTKSLLKIQSSAEALGVLYVLEGSSLGGQVISKKLREREFIKDDTLNFFNHYGTQTGLYWRNFLNFLETEFANQNFQAAEVIAAARKLLKF